MPEQLTASHIEHVQAHYEQPDFEQVGRLRDAVLNMILANYLDPDDILLAGYDANGPGKLPGDEHWDGTELPAFSFGDIVSLAPPDELSEDAETQDEHWVVNPLCYAIEYGTLGLYSKTELLKAADPKLSEYDQEFGTYLLLMDPAAVEAAKLGEYFVESEG